MRSPALTDPPRFRNALEAEAYLLSFINYERLTDYTPTTKSHDLAAFAEKLQVAGWRSEAVSTVHVGGTNAKGTVSHLIERIVRAGGMRTGLYTSPHLRSIRERVRISGRMLGARAFRSGVERLASVFAARPGDGFRTTFEHLTALAFLAFQEHAVDIAVVEVGLGGKLDATNILPPGPVVLTPISLDHQRVLGTDVAAIAADKAHILKRGGRGFIMEQEPAALESIRRRARSVGAPIRLVGESVSVDCEGWTARSAVFAIRGRGDYGRVTTHLLGEHQAENLAAAVAVAEDLLPKERVATAVRKGLTRAKIPGRLEPVVWRNRLVLVDGGHNAGAGRAVAAALRRHYPGWSIYAVIGMARDKDHREYLEPLSGVVSQFIFTRSTNPRAADPETLGGASPRATGCTEPTLKLALNRARRSRAGLILVAGSFILAGEAYEILRRD